MNLGQSALPISSRRKSVLIFVCVFSFVRVPFFLCDPIKNVDDFEEGDK